MDLTPDVCENATAVREQTMKLDVKRAGSTTKGQLILNREKSLILSPSQQKKERAANPKQQNGNGGTLVLGLKSVRFMEKTHQLQTEHTPSNRADMKTNFMA